jgi:hypothetical protein
MHSSKINRTKPGLGTRFHSNRGKCSAICDREEDKLFEGRCQCRCGATIATQLSKITSEISLGKHELFYSTPLTFSVLEENSRTDSKRLLRGITLNYMWGTLIDLTIYSHTEAGHTRDNCQPRSVFEGFWLSIENDLNAEFLRTRTGYVTNSSELFQKSLASKSVSAPNGIFPGRSPPILGGIWWPPNVIGMKIKNCIILSDRQQWNPW